MENNKEAKLINLKDVQTEDVDFLWFPYIPFGKVTLIHGNPGDGKTFLTLKLAADCSAGRALPDMPPMEPVKVIYQTAEDGLEDTIKVRLEDTNANYENIFSIDEEEESLTFSDPRIEDAIVKTGARILIFDPIQAYIGKNIDMNRANQVREGLKPLCRLAQKYNVAVILIGHLNKAQGLVSICRQIGSMDITATVRSVLIVGRHKDNPDVRVIVHDKSSLAPEGNSVAFTLNGPKGFEWLEDYDDVAAEDILSAQRSSSGKKRCTKVSKAMELLKELFKDHSTEMNADDILAIGMERIGCCDKTFKEAKKHVPGIESKRISDKWIWYFDESKIPEEERQFTADDLPIEILDDDEDLPKKEE